MSDYLMNMIKDNVDKVMVHKITKRSMGICKFGHHCFNIILKNPYDYNDDYTPLQKIGEKYITTWKNYYNKDLKKDENKVIQIEFQIIDIQLENDEIYKYLLANYKFHWIEA